MLLSTFVVNSPGAAGDPYSGDGLCDTANNPQATPPVPPSGICTLAAAVASANGNPGMDTIAFNIPGAGVPTINLATTPGSTASLGVFEPVVLDGTTQPGAGLVELRSSVGVLSLLVGSDGSTVRGLVINNSGGGIGILSDNNTIVGNRIGTNSAGTQVMGNAGNGVAIFGSLNTIGGATAQDRNIISGNGAGISIVWQDPLVSIGNVIHGNYIGTDVTGTVSDPDGIPGSGDEFGNGLGVFVNDAAENVIRDNVIAASKGIGAFIGHGVHIANAWATGNVVRGNKIGVDVNGAVALANSGDGVLIESASNNTVGGTTPAERNIISGNMGDGIRIFGTDAGDATNNRIAGNFIGTDVSGTAPLGNGSRGVTLGTHAANNAIGSPELLGELLPNLISGNRMGGVLISLDSATNNEVFFNYIGTDVNGKVCDPDGIPGNGDELGNGGHGLEIDGAPRNKIIFNTISCNAEDGLSITGITATGNIARLNRIGTDVDGRAPLGNGFSGVRIVHAPENEIGGDKDSSYNVISANGGSGVIITGILAARNEVEGNRIGTDVDGVACDQDGRPSTGDELGNGKDGVAIEGAPQNSIGGFTGYGNTISCNAADGVSITGGDATGNTVIGNFVGTKIDGIAASPPLPSLGNGSDGVEIFGANDNFIGGRAQWEENVISDNRANGVRIFSSTGNKVQGNHIGTDARGNPLGNDLDGVAIIDGFQNVIGAPYVIGKPPGVGERNRIAFNRVGVWVHSGTQNVIGVNSIFDNLQLGIDLNAAGGPAPDGVTPNDDGDRDGGANDGQNFPVFALAGSPPTRLVGTFNGLVNTGILLRFYANDALDPSLHGEGKTFLHEEWVTTDDTGNARFDIILSKAAQIGQFVCATAEINPLFIGSTSEFSRCVSVVTPVPVAELVINEIDYDQPGVDSAEFIELKNTGNSSVNLDPLAIQLIDGDGGGAATYRTIGLPDVDLAAGDYFVVCGDASNVPNCDLQATPTPTTDLIQNGAPDAVALVLNSIILDTVSYEGTTGAPYTEGSGVGLEDAANLNRVGISRLLDGEDTGQNNVDLSPRCITPGTPNSPDTAPCAAARASVLGDTLFYIAAPGVENDVTVTVSGNTATITDSPEVTITAGEGCSGGGTSAAPVNCDLTGIARVHIQLDDTDDTADFGGFDIPVTIDGGSGDDTLTLTGSGVTLDLTAPGVLIQGVETLDVSGSGDNTLTLNTEEVVNISPTTDTLIVRHDQGDTVNYGAGWMVNSPSLFNGEFRHVLKDGAATIQVVNTTPWQNPLLPLDSNRDGAVSPIDALLPINSLNAKGSRPLTAPTSASTLPEFYLDTNGDNFNSPIDVLLVFNFLNDPARLGEGELLATLVDLTFVDALVNMRVASVADQHDVDVFASQGFVAITVRPAMVRRVGQHEISPQSKRVAADREDSDLLDAIDAFFGDFDAGTP